MLDCAEHAFWVRHHDGDAAVVSGERGDSKRRAVGVQRVVFRGNVVIIDKAGRDESGLAEGFCSLDGFELGVTFAVGDRDWKNGARHFVEEDAWAVLDF